jgi:hypothetical protein
MNVADNVTYLQLNYSDLPDLEPVAFILLSKGVVFAQIEQEFQDIVMPLVQKQRRTCPWCLAFNQRGATRDV